MIRPEYIPEPTRIEGEVSTHEFSALKMAVNGVVDFLHKPFRRISDAIAKLGAGLGDEHFVDVYSENQQNTRNTE